MAKPKIALVMCPSWSIMTPPLGISYLSSYLDMHGYKTQCFDLNIETYKSIDEKWLWGYTKFSFWQKEEKFNEVVLPKIKNILEDKIDTICKDFEIIGFTIFNTSLYASLYLAGAIKKQFNGKKRIIFGGSQFNFFEDGIQEFWCVDQVVIGEGEKKILNLVREYEDGTKLRKDKIRRATGLVNLNDLPVPNYSFYNLNDYDKLSIQTSRGCVAKCTFCIEHTFSTFRFRKAENTIEEIKQRLIEGSLISFNIIDSSINSNVNEIKKLARLIIKNNIKIRWEGYMRVHSSLDYETLKLFKKSGAILLSYGVESGSQKVCDSMNKRISLEVAEKNLEYGRKVGIVNHLNWIVGFPTETIHDFLKSLLFVYNNVKNINSISPGFTCSIIPGTILDLERDKYDIAKTHIFISWHTNDFSNTVLHRYIRLKIFSDWISLLKIDLGTLVEGDIGWACGSKVNVDTKIPAPSFETSKEFSFEESIYNEYISFLWLLSRTIETPFKIKFETSKGISNKLFSDTFDVLDYVSKIEFSVDENKQYDFRLKHVLQDQERGFNSTVRFSAKIESDSFQWFFNKFML